MNAPGSPKHLTPRTTTVFTSGNSQAVRLPKDFRLSSKTVEISRRGNEIVLREKTQSLGEKLAEVWAGLPSLSEEDAQRMLTAINAGRDTRPPQERDFSSMNEEPATLKSKLAAKSSRRKA